jgi:hypothetical protein
MNHVPKGSTVTASSIVEALGKFLKVFRQKRPEMAAGDWWFHWDNVPVHTAAMVKGRMAARQFNVIEHPRPTHQTSPQPTFSSSRR